MATYGEGDWITINGRHIQIGSGESKQDAINRAIANSNEDKKKAQIAKNKEVADKLNGKSGVRETSESVQSTLPMSDVKSDKFVSAISKAKESQDEDKKWRVDVHEAKEYDEKGCKCFVSDKGSTVAVTKDGDIISVCASKSDIEQGKGVGSKLLAQAVKNGGVKLDSFGGNHIFYTKNGFEPVSWTPFNKEYAPDGWKEGRDTQEPVIFYKYVGKENVKYGGAVGYAKFLSSVKPYEGDDGYDKAMAYRDSTMKKK